MCGANLQNTFCLIGPSLTNAGLPVANVSNVAPIEMKTDASRICHYQEQHF